MSIPVDLNEYRSKTKFQHALAHPPQYTIEMWEVADGPLRMRSSDAALFPIDTNEQRADVLFDALWRGTQEPPAAGEPPSELLVLMAVYANGTTNTRHRVFTQEELHWRNVWWRLVQLFRVVRPALYGVVRDAGRLVRSNLASAARQLGVRRD